ncbi:MAG TPA: serine/threonine-protein kinase [Thermoanaerobaculia bacterium]|jgi:serine/threonine protein kinase|nr:serine/threonine-protein kinase [Thermoanaerobaculia bacterium]
MMLTQQQVGRFELRDFLGRGAIGDVYLAHDPEADRDVALKVVRTNHTDPEMLEAEKNGVSLQEQISSVAPQVATVYEWGENGGLFWVAMEYIDGADLSQRLSRGPLPEDRAAFVAHQLCEMLEACHQFSAEIAGRKVYGIVHGDIKPENIRLQDGDRVRVLDFGIAKHLSQTRRFTVNLFGSLPYTPPERLDRGGVDRHSDLWAVGVVLYLMVAGYSPFAGDDPEELEGKIRSGEPPLPLPEGVSPGLKKIIYKSLAFDPALRYATAAEMKADLEAWNEGRPLPSEGPAPERPAADDLNATRRTSRGASLDDSGSFQGSETRRTDRGTARDGGLDATRRTVEPGAAVTSALPGVPAAPGAAPASELPAVPVAPAAVEFSPPPPPAATTVLPEPPPAPPPLARRRLRLQSAGILLVVAGCLLLGSQLWVRSEAAELRHDLATETSPDLDALWSRYRRLAAISLPGSGLGDVRVELREALLKSANRILVSYHGDNPTTTQRGWQTAHERLKGAVDLDYGDRETRAKMLYARGHLARIDSQTLKSSGKRDEARQKARDAVEEFRDAARLAPTWPDPYLGLARIYTYEQFDLKELEAALSELERRGYPLGRREKAMLADGYRMQAKQLLAQAIRARDTDQEIELLEATRDHFTQAIGLYRDAGSFANAKGNMADSAEQLRGVLARLEELGVW